MLDSSGQNKGLAPISAPPHILDIFTNKVIYLEEMEQWFPRYKPLLSSITGNILVQVFNGLAQANMYDIEFVNELCKSIIKIRNSLGYSDLTSILHSLHDTKHSKNKFFINAIVSELTKFKDYTNEDLASSVWILAKLKFRDEEFLSQWSARAAAEVSTFNPSQLTQSIQGFAKLKCFDETFIDHWIDRASTNIDSFSKRTSINNAFYLTMLSVINFRQDDHSRLKLKINACVNRLLSSLEFDHLHAIKNKRQLVQIYATGIWQPAAIPEIDALKKHIHNRSTVTSSWTQQKVERFVKRTYPTFPVKAEYYDKGTATFIDLMVERTTDQAYNRFLEIDGKTHYYMNPDVTGNLVLDASTEFRNRIQSINGLDSYSIPYWDVDAGAYQAALLASLNTYPDRHWQALAETKSQQQTSAIDDTSPKQAPIATKQSKKKSIKTASTATAKKSKKEAEDDDNKILEAAIETALKESKVRPSDPIMASVYTMVTSRQPVIKKGKHTSPIETAINSCNLAATISILQQEQSPDSRTYSLTFDLAFYHFIKSYDKKEEYFDICQTLLNQYTQWDLHSSSNVKALLYSFALKETEMFELILNTIPNSSNKKELMELLFINNGGSNNIEMASLLLEKGVDINVHHDTQPLAALRLLYTGAPDLTPSDQTIHPFNPPLLQTKRDDLYSALYQDSETHTTTEVLLKDLPTRYTTAAEKAQDQGITAMHMACLWDNGHIDSVTFLLENGASPNIIFGIYGTPLYTALAKGQEEIAAKILAYKPNINIMTQYNITALHIAACKGYTAIVKTILAMQPEVINAAVTDFIIYAASSQKTRKLVKGDTLLQIALKFGDVEMFKAILEAKPDLNQPDQDGYTVLMRSILMRPELTHLLIDAGADLNIQAKNGGRTALMLAVHQSDLLSVDDYWHPAVETDCADFNTLNGGWYRAAAQAGIDIKTIREGDINSYRALTFKGLKIVEKLVLMGADTNPEIKNRDGLSAYHYGNGEYTTLFIENWKQSLLLTLNSREERSMLASMMERMLPAPSSPPASPAFVTTAYLPSSTKLLPATQHHSTPLINDVARLESSLSSTTLHQDKAQQKGEHLRHK